MVNEIQAYIKTWENRCYNTGIPDECPNEIDDLVPSYKKIAIAILKNDYSLKTLGFNVKVSKYYHILKRIELTKSQQLKLF
jgi:predicted phosphoadenosine phosphosulfate sulfurtransferase